MKTLLAVHEFQKAFMLTEIFMNTLLGNIALTNIKKQPEVHLTTKPSTKRLSTQIFLFQ